ncbi:MAG: hypothetical protein HY711_09635 [Candidatus Melainabacteria bacterium]|nr:hypothetical protein [Candidatus Melainabacteria bacterium]
MKPVKIFSLPTLICCFVSWLWLSVQSGYAAPPVRIAVIPAGGSGMEQSAVDKITYGLAGLDDVTLSTVNPDWYVLCNIVEQSDTVSSTVKINGTVTIKTVDGHVINTVAVQTNKSDFTLTPGAPLNKALVDSAVREVIAGMAERAIGPIQQAVKIEIATRDRIISAQSLADKDKYDEAIAILLPISPDTPHFRAVRALIAEFQMEKKAFELLQQAQAASASGRYTQAIQILKEVDPKSKRHKLAQERIAYCRAQLARLARLAKNKQPASSGRSATGSTTSAQLKAIEAQEKALNAQFEALKVQKSVLSGKPAK